MSLYVMCWLSFSIDVDISTSLKIKWLQHFQTLSPRLLELFTKDLVFTLVSKTDLLSVAIETPSKHTSLLANKPSVWSNLMVSLIHNTRTTFVCFTSLSMDLNNANMVFKDFLILLYHSTNIWFHGTDPSVFIYPHKGIALYMLVYVNDISHWQ